MRRRAVARWAAALAIATSLASRAETLTTTTAYEWDADGQLVREVIEPGQPQECLQLSHSYDAVGNRTSTSAAACPGATGLALASAQAARTQRVSFSADGRFVVKLTNAMGHTETRSVDAAWGWVLRSVDANGLVVQQQFDAFGRLVRRVHPDRTALAWERVACSGTPAACEGGRPEQPPAWVLIERSFGAGGGALGQPRVQVHDAAGRVVRTQAPGLDGSPIVQDTFHDRMGRVQRRSAPYALQASLALDTPGSPSGPAWTDYTWDVLGRPGSQSRPDAAAAGGQAVTRWEYDGLSVSVTDSLGRRTLVQRNALGLPERIVDAAGGVLVHRYDAAGRLVQSFSDQAAQAPSTVAWDRRGRRSLLSDPSLGTWRYGYNVFGELVWQQGGLGQVTTYAYDALGRMTERRERDLLSIWLWDRGADAAPCGARSVGRLCEARADNGYRRSLRHDDLGRLVSSATVLDDAARPAIITQAWDAQTGRLAERTWPTGLRARYAYSDDGWLRRIEAQGAGLPQPATFEALQTSAQGQLARWKQGGWLQGSRSFDAASGRLLEQMEAGADGRLVRAQSWRYDSQGNLRSRTQREPGASWQEAYAYDALDRLQLYTTTRLGTGPAGQSVQLQYDARGNIAYKSDVGRYWYDPQRPDRLLHVTLDAPAGAIAPLAGTRAMDWAYDELAAPAPASVPGPASPSPPALVADAAADAGSWRGDGNLVYAMAFEPASGRRVLREHRYSSFDMPVQYRWSELATSGAVPAAMRTLRFVYGPEHQRVRQQAEVAGDASGPGSAVTTWYLHEAGGQELLYEKLVPAGGQVEHRHYLGGAGLVWAMVVSRGSAPAPPSPAPPTSPASPTSPMPAPSAPLVSAVRYLHQDALGSLVAISDEAGNVLERLAYDPWGRRRWPDGRADARGELAGWLADRGYTFHEHLDEMGLVHMNARVYDPTVARFLSPDPFLQSPDNLQSHNRYAYVGNNPTGHADPSGYFSLGRVFRAAAAVAIAVFAPEVFAAHGIQVTGMTAGGAMAINSAAAGALAGAVASGTARGALQGGVSAGLFYAAGGIGSAGSVERYLAHAAAGCAGAAVGAGRCTDGAAGALAGKVTSNALDGWNDPIGRGFAAAMAGGVGSVAAGGRFDHGALQAAAGYAFNECGHTRACGSDSTRVTVSGNRVVGDMAHGEIQISSGYEFEILEGQPGYPRGSPFLQGRSNGANDGDAFAIDVRPWDDRTMGEFASRLREGARSYRDDVLYGFPSSGNRVLFGYNSNSYLAGLLQFAAPEAALASTVSGAAAASGYRLPGLERPLPLGRIR